MVSHKKLQQWVEEIGGYVPAGFGAIGAMVRRQEHDRLCGEMVKAGHGHSL